MRAFSRSPIRRENPGNRREDVNSRRDSPSYRREVRRRSPYRESHRKEQRYHHRRNYDYSPSRHRQSKSPSDYQTRHQSSSPDKGRTQQQRESRWDSHVKHKREELKGGESSETQSGEQEKLIVLSKWVRRHSNNESEWNNILITWLRVKTCVI